VLLLRCVMGLLTCFAGEYRIHLIQIAVIVRPSLVGVATFSLFIHFLGLRSSSFILCSTLIFLLAFPLGLFPEWGVSFVFKILVHSVLSFPWFHPLLLVFLPWSSFLFLLRRLLIFLLPSLFFSWGVFGCYFFLSSL
jgi:hypothetical protein